MDIYGNRFMNEDVGGQPFQNQLSRLPKKTAWQIFDSKWKDQIKYMDTGHGNVNWYVESGSEVPNGSYGKNAYISEEDNEDGNTPGFTSYFEGDKAVGVTANSIAELAKLMEVDEATLTATIERYNELAAAGNDEDFGKRADRLFPVEEGPFYAYPLTDTVILVNMGGLQTDVDFNVMDTEDELIEGLYAVGTPKAAASSWTTRCPRPASATAWRSRTACWWAASWHNCSFLRASAILPPRGRSLLARRARTRSSGPFAFPSIERRFASQMSRADAGASVLFHHEHVAAHGPDEERGHAAHEGVLDV